MLLYHLIDINMSIYIYIFKKIKTEKRNLGLNKEKNKLQKKPKYF